MCESLLSLHPPCERNGGEEREKRREEKPYLSKGARSGGRLGAKEEYVWKNRKRETEKGDLSFFGWKSDRGYVEMMRRRRRNIMKGN